MPRLLNGRNLNMLCKSINGIVLRIMMPLMVFITVYGNDASKDVGVEVKAEKTIYMLTRCHTVGQKIHKGS
jgi:hypothetical protein